MTDEERARIWAKTRAESERLLSCDFSNPPPPDEQSTRGHGHALPPLEFEDPVERWKREANEATRRRELADAERKRQEREDERRRGADWWAAIDARIDAALAGQRDNVAELARASVEFANAVQDRLLAMETLLARLDTKLTELRAIDDQHRVVDMPKLVRRTN
jgi:hypothetical protein